MARIFDSSCGDLVAWADITDEWSYQNDATGVCSVEAGVSGASGNCILLKGQNFSNLDSMLRKNLPGNYTRLIVGGRYKNAAIPSAGYRLLWGFWDNAAVFQIGLFVDASGRLSLWRTVGATSLQVGTYTLSNTIQGATWAYVELDVTFDNAGAGAFQLRVNSQSIQTVSSVTTANNANAASMFSLHCGASGTAEISWHYHDDIYINDTTGSRSNGFDGDIRGLPILPTAAGRLTQQAIGGSGAAATNWQSVNQAVPDGDVTYVAASTTGLKDTYKVAALPANVITIVSVTTVLNTKTDTSGLGAGAMIRPLIGNGATEANGTSVSLNTSYAGKYQYYGLNPITGIAWALADWPNIEIGHERTA